MIHIVFEKANVDILQKVIELDETLEGEIFEIKDDYAVGPIDNLYETEGYQERKNWWKNVLENSVYENELNIVDDKLTIHQITKYLENNENEIVWIWMAQNQHDVCGYYWLISQLKNFQGRVEVLYLNNLPFINEKGLIFYPEHLHEIQASEFLKAKKLARVITPSEFEIDPDEWKKIGTENSGIRILEGGKKIASKSEDYFDKDIMSVITQYFLKLTKILNQIISKSKLNMSDVFLVHRVKILALENKLEIQGDWQKGWKEIEIKKMEKDSSNID